MEILNQLWAFFYGTIERWNAYIARLEQKQREEEQQLVPWTAQGGQSGPGPKGPHAATKSYTEETFKWNLNWPDEKPPQTTDDQVNVWLQDFAVLRIDAFRMVLDEQTLPDQTFIRKRYLKLQKEVHPDRTGGGGQASTELNVAKDSLDHFYASIPDQITFFRTIFANPFGALGPDPSDPGQVPRLSTSPLLLIYLVGVGAGLMVVYVRSRSRKKVEGRRE